MEKPALLVIDMQVGNFEGANPIYNGSFLLDKIQRLIEKARNSEIPIIYVQNNGGKEDPDEFGTPGWEIHPSISPLANDIIVQKEIPDSFHNTRLQEELNMRGVNKLIIGGLQTEYCIDTTCRRAYSLGYKVILVKDAHSTWDSTHFSAEEIINHHNEVLGSFFVTLKKEQELYFK